MKPHPLSLKNLYSPTRFFMYDISGWVFLGRAAASPPTDVVGSDQSENSLLLKVATLSNLNQSARDCYGGRSLLELAGDF